MSLKRLQQLRIQEPSLVMRDERHKMVEVDLTDFDAEVLGQDGGVDDGFFQTTTTSTTETTTTTTKEVNVEDSLKELHHKGLITREEMAEMMTLLNKPPPPVVKKRKRPKKTKRPQSSAIPFALEQPSHRPKTFRPVQHKRPSKRPATSAIAFEFEQPHRSTPKAKRPSLSVEQQQNRLPKLHSSKVESPTSYSYVEIRLGKDTPQTHTVSQHSSSTPRSLDPPVTPRIGPVITSKEPFESLRMDNPFTDPFSTAGGHLVEGPEFLPPIGALPKQARRKPFTRHLTTTTVAPEHGHGAVLTTYAVPPSSSYPREPFHPQVVPEVKILGRRRRPLYGTKKYPRQEKSLKIHVTSKGLPDVPDFTTAAPFPYDATPTRTGHASSDHTMEDIRQSFLQGERTGTAFTRSIY